MPHPRQLVMVGTYNLSKTRLKPKFLGGAHWNWQSHKSQAIFFIYKWKRVMSWISINNVRKNEAATMFPICFYSSVTFKLSYAIILFYNIQKP